MMVILMENPKISELYKIETDLIKFVNDPGPLLILDT